MKQPFILGFASVIAIAAVARPAAADENAAAPPREAPGDTEPSQGSRPPQRWAKVPYGAIAASRTQGTDDLVPDDETKAEIASKGRPVAGTFRLCLDGQGAVARVHAVKRTGFPTYDEQIRRELAAWRFRPPRLADKSTAVCAVVAVAYPPGKVEPYAPGTPAASAPSVPSVPEPSSTGVPEEPGTPPALPPLPRRRRIGALIRFGLDFGGTKLARFRFSGGGSETLKAGQLAWLGAGFLYQPASPWSLEATLGYKTHRRSESDGSIHFSRFPLDVVVSFATRGHRVGVGTTAHFLPTFSCDVGVCGASEKMRLDTSIGFLIQWAYGIRRNDRGGDLGVRFTRLSYHGSGIGNFDGSSLGVFFGGWL